MVAVEVHGVGKHRAIVEGEHDGATALDRENTGGPSCPDEANPASVQTRPRGSMP